MRGLLIAIVILAFCFLSFGCGTVSYTRNGTEVKAEGGSLVLSRTYQPDGKTLLSESESFIPQDQLNFFSKLLGAQTGQTLNPAALIQLLQGMTPVAK